MRENRQKKAMQTAEKNAKRKLKENKKDWCFNQEIDLLVRLDRYT